MSVAMNKVVEILYTNYKGETGWQKNSPQQIWFGPTEWHTENQWLLDAHDIEKDAVRNFSMKDIQEWKV